MITDCHIQTDLSENSLSMMCGQHVELSEAAEAKVKQLYNQVLNIPG